MCKRCVYCMYVCEEYVYINFYLIHDDLFFIIMINILIILII